MPNYTTLGEWVNAIIILLICLSIATYSITYIISLVMTIQRKTLSLLSAIPLINIACIIILSMIGHGISILRGIIPR